MGVAVGDYDGDGLLDIFVTNFTQESNALYRNLGREGFSDQASRAGLAQKSFPYVGWGTALIDFDNDGWPDSFVVNGHVYPQVDVIPNFKVGEGYRQPMLLFRNLGNGNFEDVEKSSGLESVALASRRGAAFGDLNNDGLIDVVIVNIGEAPTVLLNVSEGANQSVTLKLVGKGKNQQAIGARVVLTTGSLKQTQEVEAGSSYLSQNDLRLHFGIGNAKEAALEIRWPDRQKESIPAVKAGQIVTITQGKGVTASEAYSARLK
jgi:enediyne biosynthesis protein E4